MAKSRLHFRCGHHLFCVGVWILFNYAPRPVYFLAGPGPDWTFFESGPDFIMSIRSGFYHVGLGPDVIHFESGTDFFMLVRLLYILSKGPGKDFIKDGRPTRFRILSIFESGSGFFSIRSGSGYHLNNFVSSFCICILTISCFNLKQLFSPSKLYYFVLSLFYMHELIIVLRQFRANLKHVI